MPLGKRGSEEQSSEESTWRTSGAALRSRGIVPFRSSDRSSAWMDPEPGTIPERYRVREQGDETTLRCVEAPSVEVRIQRSFAFTEAEARKEGERRIFLDGAGQFAPILDNEQRLYNLDHHLGCLRAFTLATCEQALILVFKGLELDQGDWTVYANEPDLDTIFAIWVLLNHRRLKSLRQSARDVLFPLLRLEGAIDANGLEIAELCGLPSEAVKAGRMELDRLHAIELEIKKSGHWDKADLASYTQRMLGEIDQLVYTGEDFQDFTSIEEEYGHVEIGGNRVAVVCRDPAGIYETEKRLKRHWGDRLGIVALETAPRTFTLRRSASLVGIDLETAYRQLNLQDRAVDGRPPEKRWGGSDDIGGSPRPTGTLLEPQEIGRVLWDAYREKTAWSRAQRVLLALGAALVPALAALAGVLSLQLAVGPPGDLVGYLQRTAVGAGFALAAAGIQVWKSSESRAWLYGLRRPAGKDWFLLLPVALAGLLAMGSWLPGGVGGPPLVWGLAALALVLVAVALELWFRALVHGIPLLDFEIQHVGSRWFVSLPALLSALAFGSLAFGAAKLGVLLTVSGLPGPPALGAALCGAVAGLALAATRERSMSLVPGILLQIAAGLVWIFLLQP